MVDKNTVKQIEENIAPLGDYLRGLQMYPGNAALKWIADSCETTAGIADNKKKAIENIRKILKYIEDQTLLKDTAAMRHVKEKLNNSLNLLIEDKAEPEPEPIKEYDEPNPQPEEEE